MNVALVPPHPKIYHIVHVDRLSSIVADGFLWCDAEVARRNPVGTTIGMSNIKQRRLELHLSSHPNLHVGDCVPFYFCPRSIMLYLIHKGNDLDLGYRGGQEPILHLESDLRAVVTWADAQQVRWAFTPSNAGSSYFDDYSDLAYLGKINWAAVQAKYWQHLRYGKQAEFLLEHRFPWHLIERIGVYSPVVHRQVINVLPLNGHRPTVEICKDWYY